MLNFYFNSKNKIVMAWTRKSGHTHGRDNTAYCELFCWYRCVYDELT